jgi:S-ribosylhomocysteine lyase LuxS involved in autoinducer biosynthesis
MDVDDDPTQSTVDSTQTASASQHAFQQNVNNKILEDLFARMSRCHTLGELIRMIPAPAQAATKEVLEKVTDAFTRQGVCEVLKTSWQDALDKREYDRIPELNSLKAPSVQISRLAKEIDEKSLNAINFTSALQDAKTAALTIMIGIKQQEIHNLNQLCSERIIRGKIVKIWTDISREDGITPEHMTILLNRGCAERLVQMAISIGHDSLTRSANTKKKRLEKKDEAEADKTDLANNQKSLRALVHEEMKRMRQSEKDKKINSKKGSGRAGPPKTPKNPKNAKNRATKVTKKNQPANARKAGPSSRQQRKKR